MDFSSLFPPAPFAGGGGDLRGVFHLHALSLAHVGLQARAALPRRPTGGAGSGIAPRVDEGDDGEICLLHSLKKLFAFCNSNLFITFAVISNYGGSWNHFYY